MQMNLLVKKTQMILMILIEIEIMPGDPSSTRRSASKFHFTINRKVT